MAKDCKVRIQHLRFWQLPRLEGTRFFESKWLFSGYNHCMLGCFKYGVPTKLPMESHPGLYDLDVTGASWPRKRRWHGRVDLHLKSLKLWVISGQFTNSKPPRAKLEILFWVVSTSQRSQTSWPPTFGKFPSAWRPRHTWWFMATEWMYINLVHTNGISISKSIDPCKMFLCFSPKRFICICRTQSFLLKFSRNNSISPCPCSGSHKMPLSASQLQPAVAGCSQNLVIHPQEKQLNSSISCCSKLMKWLEVWTQGCRFGPESSRQTLVSPISRSLCTICGG